MSTSGSSARPEAEWSGEPTVSMAAVREERAGSAAPVAAARPGSAGAVPPRAASSLAVPARARRARLVLTRVDPWSVMKLSFLLSLALGIVLVVAVALLWSVLDGMGVFDSVNRTVGDLTTGEGGSRIDLSALLALRRVLIGAAMLAGVDVILLTALSTLGAFLYNVTSALVGGLHVTLSEDA